MTKSLLLLSGAVGAFVFAASGVQAATATAATDTAAATDQGATNVGELVVVAEKREQNLQKVPVAVSVFTGAQRDTIGINSVQEVTNFAPGFAYDPGNTHAYIRGVGRQSINLTNDARVATYEDGFYVVSPYQLDKSSLFLSQEQIERGPQNVGGRNADGGSIDMISVRPTDTPYAELRATAGNFNHYEVEGAVSGQVTPGLDLRLSAYDNQQNDGYFKNLDLGQPTEGGQINEWYVEGQLDWKPNDNAELWLRAFTSAWDNRGDAGARTGYESGHWDETNLTDPNAYPGAGLFVNPNFGYASVAGSGARNGANNVILAGAGPAFLVGTPYLPTPGSLTLANPGVTDNPALTNPYNIADLEPRTVSLSHYNDVNYVFTYKFPTFEFRYVGGFQGYDYNLNYSEPDTAVTSFALPVLAAGVAPLVINPLVNLNYQQDDSWTSHEFDLQSTGDAPLQWIGGIYYYSENYTNPILATAPDQPQLSHPLASLTTFAAAAPNLNNTLFFQNYDLHDQSVAGYGQVSYKFNDQFTVTGNLRYTYDTKDGTESNRDVAFNNTLIDTLAPFLGAGTPSLDSTLALTCPTGNPASCYSGTTLGKGVSSAGVVNAATGIEQRGLSGTSSALTGGAGIDWQPTNDIFVYARYSRGYEDFSLNAGYISPNPYVAPEFINSYEIGYKQAIGHNISIDTAAFYYDYNNLQVPIAVLNGGVVQSEFVNSPKAVSEGIEFEGEWSPIHNLLITASYSYDHTALETGCTLSGGVPTAGSLCVVDTNDTFAVEPGANPVAGQPAGAARFQSVKGNPLPEAPANKLALDVAYTWEFDPGSFTLSGSYVWRDTQDGTIFDRSYDNAPSWNDVSLRALWKGAGDKYEIIGFIKNVFNNQEYEAADGGAGLLGNTVTNTTAAAGLIETNVFNLAPPRTYGVEVRYKFF
ncbi:MAG TPA: TonB-dependent receptor [Caulobacteraceae bacterium]|jgi:iron complex outermembrane receptor protein|nr:TonB-dependent receptor [Caulobacteraceae bacterium]